MGVASTNLKTQGKVPLLTKALNERLRTSEKNDNIFFNNLYGCV